MGLAVATAHRRKAGRNDATGGAFGFLTLIQFAVRPERPPDFSVGAFFFTGLPTYCCVIDPLGVVAPLTATKLLPAVAIDPPEIEKFVLLS